jgi:hypothetical protein
MADAGAAYVFTRGGGLNASLSGPLGAPVTNDAIDLAAPLADGASISVQFLLGIQKTGAFRFYLNIEALP